MLPLAVAASVGTVLAVSLGMGVLLVLAQRQPDDATHLPVADAALVLGAQVQVQGRLNPCLAARVQAASALFHAGKVQRLIVSGGNDAAAGCNEARAMRQLAIDQGVPAAHILLEPQARSTAENIRLSLPLMDDLHAQTVILVSSDYHLARAHWLAVRIDPSRRWHTFASTGVRAGHWHVRSLALGREVLAWADNALRLLPPVKTEKSF